jgi:hypothetical protein
MCQRTRWLRRSPRGNLLSKPEVTRSAPAGAIKTARRKFTPANTDIMYVVEGTATGSSPVDKSWAGNRRRRTRSAAIQLTGGRFAAARQRWTSFIIPSGVPQPVQGRQGAVPVLRGQGDRERRRMNSVRRSWPKHSGKNVQSGPGAASIRCYSQRMLRIRVLVLSCAFLLTGATGVTPRRAARGGISRSAISRSRCRISQRRSVLDRPDLRDRLRAAGRTE